jgi:hypothetical protein
MRDNFKLIRDYITFDSKDDFYFLQILQRKKDGPGPDGVQIKGTNNKARAIKSYCITSKEYLDSIEYEVKQLCNFFNARAMMYVSKRSFKLVALENMKLCADNIYQDNYTHSRTNYWKACGLSYSQTEKVYLVDIDAEDMHMLDIIRNYIESATIRSKMEPGKRIILEVPTKTGIHLLCHPFDVATLQKFYPKPNHEFVHKNSPTCVYIP